MEDKTKKPLYTDSQIPIDEVYTKSDVQRSDPGVFPFTRGVNTNMYRGKMWTMRQYAGFSTAEESNKRYKYLLSQGTTGLSVAFDLPTQIGYDSDHVMSEGEVGKVGVAIDSLRDIETLFDGIDLEKISTSMTINSTASILLSMYIALAKKQGLDVKEIRGTIQNDLLKEYVARGTFIYPPRASLKIITDVFEYCSKEVPRWNTISISGYHIREAGSTAAQEAAFTLSNGKAYVLAALDKGLDINVFGKRLSFFFNCHNNFFEEVAKFRAARKIWAKTMKELGASDERAMKLRFHTQTAGSTLMAQQPRNNLMRVAFQALAAVMGGTQSLHTNGYDEALSLPTEEAATLALRTQQIIANEIGVVETADPLCGSYYVEYLTDELEKKVLAYMKIIDDMGGAVAAIEKNYMQDEIARAAYDYQKKISNKEQVIVGLNAYKDADANTQPPIFKVDDSIRQKQIEKLKQLKKERDNESTTQCLEQLRQAAIDDVNLMPHILTCVENYATLGEIADTLRDVYGEYK